MKAPGWIHIGPAEVRDGQVICTLTIRRWHPGYWLARLRGRLAARRRLQARGFDSWRTGRGWWAP